MMIRTAGLIGALVAGAAAAQGAPVTVSSAASLANVLGRLASEYGRRTGERVLLNVGASNVLARQIAAGARVDLFISADGAQMDLVSDHIDPRSRVPLLRNQLAIAVPDGSSRVLSSARDLADPSIRRVALGDPAAVPAGVYAKAYLQQLGIWDAIAPKVVPAGSVRLALAAVESGAADAAVVYRTDILAGRRAREAFVVPLAEAPPVVYPAAIVKGGPNAEGARRFLAFLRGAEASAAFERAGFLRP